MSRDIRTTLENKHWEGWEMGRNDLEPVSVVMLDSALDVEFSGLVLTDDLETAIESFIASYSPHWTA